MENTKNKIFVCGPIFNTPSGPGGQGGKLYTKLKLDGYEVYKRSIYKNRLFRLLDILYFLLLKTNKYDIILLQMFSNRAFILEDVASRIAKLLNKRYIPVIRGGAFVEFYNKNPVWADKVLKRAHKIVTPSNFITEFLINKGYEIINIPNFIETQKFPDNWKLSDTKKLLWVRAFHDIYKPEFAINAVYELKKEFPDIKLTMVGPDQGKLKYCRELIDSLNLNQNIEIVGVISNNALTSFYSSHSLYLNTTSYESFGVALIEAACSGIPIVSTSVGDIPYIWEHEKDILLSEDNDIIAFEKNIKRLLIDYELQTKLSTNARIKAEKYNWDNIKDLWKKVLQ